MPPIAGSKTGFVYVNEFGDDKLDNPSKNQATPRDFSEQNFLNKII